GTLFMILLAVFYVLLAKLSPREEIVVGTPIAGRSHPDLENIIGVFINTLALKNRPSGVNSFNAFLGEVKEGALAAFENQEFPFEELVERLPVSRDAGRNPLFDVMFALQNMDREAADNPGLEITPYDEYEYGISKFDLTLFAQRSEETLCFHLQYSTALFKEETVKRFARYFKGIVSRIIESPGVNISQIEILSPDEKREILEGFNDTATQYPRDKTIHQLFREQAARTPRTVALVHRTHRTSMSYMTYDQ
ncbi:MAG: hypothetical protein GY950_12790, partial [bacterium]|nr:hypothetical protein [bacterium]